MNKEGKIAKHILTKYHKYGRPVLNSKDPVNVKMVFVLANIENVDEVHETLTTFGWMQLYWNDPYLRWNYSRYDNIKHIVLNGNDIWLPRLEILNSAQDSAGNGRDSNSISLKYDGSIKWNPLYRFVSTCDMDMTYFPFDEQRCLINLTSWVYGPKSVNYVLHEEFPVRFDAYQSNGEWRLIGWNITVHIDEKSIPNSVDDDPDYQVVIVNFAIHRRGFYYVDKIIVPCILLTIIATLAFLLPSESGERIALGISVFSSFYLLRMVVSGYVPRTYQHTSLLSIYFTSCLTITALSVALSIVILTMFHHSPFTPVSPWMKKIIFGILGKLVCRQNTAKYSTYFTDQYCDNTWNLQSKTPTVWHEFIKRVSEESLNLLKIQPKNRNASLNAQRQTSRDEHHPNTAYSTNFDDRHPSIQDVESSNKDTFREIQWSHNRHDWALATKILNRCLFLIFSALIITTSACFMISLQNYIKKPLNMNKVDL